MFLALSSWCSQSRNGSSWLYASVAKEADSVHLLQFLMNICPLPNMMLSALLAQVLL